MSDNSETKNSHDISFEQANNGVTALLNLVKENEKDKLNIIKESSPVFLQIDFIKIPVVKRKVVRIPLPNSLLTETSEVCLFVADLIRGRKVDHEMTINHYKKLLAKRGITTEISQIIPSRQVRVEYGTYEAKRKLCNMFDVFLIDNKISEFLIPKLGKPFQKARKWPIPIRIKRKNLLDEITSKLKKTSMLLNDSGLTKIIQVGHSDMSAAQIAENIVYVLNNFGEYISFWSWENIRYVNVKSAKSAAIPLYMSFALANSIPIPKEKKKKSKPAVTDELSTLGKSVTVFANGRVRVRALCVKQKLTRLHIHIILLMLFVFILTVIVILLNSEIEARRKILRGRKTITRKYYHSLRLPAWIIVTLIAGAILIVNGLVFFILNKVIIKSNNPTPTTFGVEHEV